MGHSHGTKWTEKNVIEKLREVMKAIDVNRMPSHSEMTSVTGDYALSNKISKDGGTQKWADKLNLRSKNSCTAKGEVVEKEIFEKIKSMGYKVELLNSKSPYDILVEGQVRIEVKYSSGFQDAFYTFNLYDGKMKSDIYILVGRNDNMENKTLLIPSNRLNCKTQINLYKKSKYDKYIGRWDYITKFNDFMESLNIPEIPDS
jgi:hypothetical protein